MAVEASRSHSKSPWPLRSLAGFTIGQQFHPDLSLIRFERNLESEKEFEFVHEVWTSQNPSLELYVYETCVVGISTHSGVVVHEVDLSGKSIDALTQQLGTPTFRIMDAGVGRCEYENGTSQLSIGFWNNTVSWASLIDLAYLDN